MVRKEVRDKIQLCHSSQVGNSYPVCNDPCHSKEAKVGQDNFFLLLLLEQGRIGRVMLAYFVKSERFVGSFVARAGLLTLV